MSGTQNHSRRLARLKCFLPARCTQAPTVIRLGKSAALTVVVGGAWARVKCPRSANARVVEHAPRSWK